MTATWRKMRRGKVDGRHRFVLNLLEAALWLLLFARSFAWADDPLHSNWFVRALDLLLAAMALSRAIRHKREQPVEPAA